MGQTERRRPSVLNVPHYGGHKKPKRRCQVIAENHCEFVMIAIKLTIFRSCMHTEIVTVRI